MADSFDSRSTLEVSGREYEIHRLDALQSKYDVARLPYSLKVLLENVLRLEDGESVTTDDVETIATWDAKAEPSKEIPFQPARVLMQDFTGVPAVVDLAAMRDAMEELGSDAAKINPLVPVDLVIDHSVQVDAFGNERAFEINAEREFERNQERYEFLRWGQKAFDNFRVVPPATGICHQVNLEYLGRVVYSEDKDGTARAYPDTLVGTDSHTTMINGLSVLGWGVGGIEAEAAMLGQPISMLLPQVLGFRLDGELPDAATATDLVLRVTEMLREKGVVSKFVEFYGPGLPSLGLADRATLGNMSPEFGSTCAIFPPDKETLRYLEFTGRPTETIELVDAYTREQGMFHDADSEDPTFSDTLELDLGDVVPSIAGPKRPQDRIALTDSKSSFLEMLKAQNEEKARNGHDETVQETFPASDAPGDDRSDTAEERSQDASDEPAEPDEEEAAVATEAKGSDCDRGHRRRRQHVRAGPRARRHRGDHELHEHLEPVGDDRRRAARQEGGRARPRRQALGEDVACPGIDGGHRLPRAGRPRRVPQQAQVRPGRLRLHHLHRQLRARSRTRSPRRSTRRTSWSARCSPATATSRAGSTRT